MHATREEEVALATQASLCKKKPLTSIYVFITKIDLTKTFVWSSLAHKSDGWAFNGEEDLAGRYKHVTTKDDDNDITGKKKNKAYKFTRRKGK